MRCATCGRLMPGCGSDWALHCRCGGPQVPKHPCAKCDKSMDCAFGFGVPDCDALAAWLVCVPMSDMLAAVKADPVVGSSRCSRIAECVGFGDDLKRELALAGCDTPAKAVKWARDDERRFLEQGLNQRWGEDDDPQIGMMRDFEAACRDNPVR